MNKMSKGRARRRRSGLQGVHAPGAGLWSSSFPTRRRPTWARNSAPSPSTSTSPKWLKRLNPLMHRLGLNLYAGQITRPEQSPIRASAARSSATPPSPPPASRGLELVFFPILIASLIVLNTMLGSVFERIKEIHIFSSIGLAPVAYRHAVHRGGAGLRDPRLRGGLSARAVHQ